jgi:hypothetical protein
MNRVPHTHVVVEQLAHGQWHCLCPDGVPRAVVSYIEAMTGALYWATQGGYGIYCTNLDGERDFALWADSARLAASRNGGAA